MIDGYGIQEDLRKKRSKNMPWENRITELDTLARSQNDEAGECYLHAGGLICRYVILCIHVY